MFMETFKFFKRKDADISLVIDPDSHGAQGKLIRKSALDIPDPSRFGVLPATSWVIYELPNHPGLLLIRNPFTALGQRYWSARCLKDYQRPPNPTNLSNLGQGTDDWWLEVQSIEAKNEQLKLRNSLRWVTLGYHHNWDTKIYSEASFNAFPEDLHSLIASVFAPALGHHNFNPQAAIVNYYPQGSTLSGHTDHSEVNLEAPLFSISFGQAAVFLIGGRDKSDPATPILLRSGDVLVMAKESRLCYHAVPRILHGSEERWNELGEEGEEKCSENNDLWSKCRDSGFWRPFDMYLRDCRINLNVRQVLNKDQERIS